MKKTVSLLLCLFTVFCFAACGKQPEKTDAATETTTDYKNYTYTKPDAALSASGNLGGAVTWEFYGDGSLFVEGSGSMPDWTKIKDLAWRDKINDIKSVHIGKGITAVGDFAFAYCHNLTFVYISETVTSIGNSAFIRCEKLTSVQLPDSVTEIEAFAFAHCLSLESVNIPENATTLGDTAFGGCSKIKEIRLHGNISYIGSYCFAGWGEEQSITIESPESYINENWNEDWDINCSASIKISYE